MPTLPPATPRKAIPPGYRVLAVTLTTPVPRLAAGDRVDILVRARHREEDGRRTTRYTVIAENVAVFAGDEADERFPAYGAERETTVSLLLTPEQIPTIAAADDAGKLRLVVRGPAD